MLSTGIPVQSVYSASHQSEMAVNTQSVLSGVTNDRKIPQFDPEIHLNFEPPTTRYSFTGLRLEKPHNAPDVCYTEPFQLFSEEGVRVMRREIFRQEFLDKYMRSWARAPCYIGGHSANAEVSLVRHLSCVHKFVSANTQASWSFLILSIKIFTPATNRH
jgi:hypothetical protein